MKKIINVLSVLLVVAFVLYNFVPAIAEKKNIEYGSYQQKNLFGSNALNLTDQFADKIKDNWDELKDRINIESFNIHKDEVGELYFAVLNDNPEYFYVSGYFTYSYSIGSGNVKDINVDYHYEKNEIASLKTKFNAAIDKALEVIQPLMNEEQKVLAIHDYLALNCEYNRLFFENVDLIDKESYTAYGCLVKNLAVCQGYSYAFKLLMNDLGIECSIVTSDQMNHAWNMIRLNGEYYHIDVTWDDPMTKSSDNKHVDLLGKVSHTYFLLTDEQMLENDHYNWKAESDSSDKAYKNAFWNNVKSAVYYQDGYQYYINDNGAVIKRNTVDLTQSIIFQIEDGKWGMEDNTYYTWHSGEAKILLKDSVIYFNTNDKIYSINTEGKQKKVVFDSKLTQKYITGITEKNNQILYDTMDKQLVFDLRLNAGELPQQTTEPTTSPTTTDNGEPTSEGELVYGDINGDKNINAKDVLLLKQYLANWAVTVDKVAADVNVDKVVNSKDSLLLRKYVANWDVVLGPKR